jgi:imidazolonepropionase-like amidohydrolase
VSYALVGGTLLDGTGADPVENTTVVVEDGKIAAVGGSVPDGAAAVDVSGLTIMPGLVDCHVHIANHHILDSMEWLKETNTLATARATVYARQMLLGGFTTIRDAGAIRNVAIGLGQAIDARIVPGPRVLACGQYLAMLGRDSWGKFRPEVQNNMEVEVVGVDEARRAARQQIRLGAKCIKVQATGIGAGADRVQLTEEEMAAAVEEAHHAGLHAFSHATNQPGAWNAVRAGVDSLEHGNDMTEETVALMAEQGTYFCPTVSFTHRAFVEPERMVTPAARFERIRGRAVRRRESFEAAMQYGIRFVNGSDAAGLDDVWHHDAAFELIGMVAFGLTPMQAVVAATSNAADLLKLPIGRVEAGKLADLIAVDGRPWEDVACLRDRSKIRLVAKDGELYRDEIGTGLPLSPLMDADGGLSAGLPA